MAAKAAIMAVREVDNLVNNARPIHTMPRSGSPVLREPMFDWKVAKNIRKGATMR